MIVTMLLKNLEGLSHEFEASADSLQGEFIADCTVPF